MSHISANSSIPLNQAIAQASQDGVITTQEFNQLSETIKGSALPQSEKEALTQVLSKARFLTNHSFLSDGKVQANELASLRRQAQELNSPAAQAFVSGLEQNIQVAEGTSSILGSLMRAIGRGISTAFGIRPEQNSPEPVQTSSTPLAPPDKTATYGTPIDYTQYQSRMPQVEAEPVMSFVETPDYCPPGDVECRTNQNIKQWFVPQYYEAGDPGNASNCGPACVAMALRANGMAYNLDLQDIRGKMRAANKGATSSYQLDRGIEQASGGKLKASIVEGNKDYKRDPKAFLERAKAELAAGNQVILLTKNMATHKNGHYVVLQRINEDGSLVVADPGNRAKGINRAFSYENFVKAFNGRIKDGMPNNLVVVKKA